MMMTNGCKKSENGVLTFCKPLLKNWTHSERFFLLRYNHNPRFNIIDEDSGWVKRAHTP